MKSKTNQPDGRSCFQAQALERREECMETIRRAAVNLAINDEMLVRSAFTEVVIELARFPETDRALPMSLVCKFARRYLIRHQRTESRRRQREEQYAYLRPLPGCYVAGVNVDEVDYRSVEMALRKDTELTGHFSPFACRLAVEIAAYAATENRTPTQSHLACVLGVSQATVHRVLPTAMLILRRAIERLQG